MVPRMHSSKLERMRNGRTTFAPSGTGGGSRYEALEGYRSNRPWLLDAMVAAKGKPSSDKPPVASSRAAKGATSLRDLRNKSSTSHLRGSLVEGMIRSQHATLAPIGQNVAQPLYLMQDCRRLASNDNRRSNNRTTTGASRSAGSSADGRASGLPEQSRAKSRGCNLRKCADTKRNG